MGESFLFPRHSLARFSFSLFRASISPSSTCALSVCTTLSSFFSLSMSSPSGAFLDLRGARPGPGNIHSIFARAQLEHGCFLSHLTLRLRHVMQDLGLAAWPTPPPPAAAPWPGAADDDDEPDFCTRSCELDACNTAKDCSVMMARGGGEGRSYIVTSECEKQKGMGSRVGKQSTWA
jgi:hypothetical protein